VNSSVGEAGTRRQAPGAIFVGREPELELLRARLEAARAGERAILFVEGRGGMGKTSLVRRVLAEAGNFTLLRGDGDEAEMQLPFGVIDQLVGGLPDRSPALDPARWEADSDPVAVGSALVDLVGARAAGGPVALVVDDLHWCDTPSLAALAFALRRLRADPLLALLVGRPEAVLPAGLSRLVDEDGVDRIRLAGLDASAVRELATRMGITDLPRRSLDRLMEHTAGSPLHARALLEELSPEALRSSEPLPAPRAFSSVVLSRLATLSPPAQDLVVAASGLGPRSPLRLASRVAGLDDPGPAVEEATASGLLLLARHSGGWELSFPHPLIRAAVYDDLSPRRRSAVHARAAELTEGDARLGHRVAGALGDDSLLAAELEARAKDEASSGALAPAAGHLLSAARLAPASTDRERCLLEGVRLQVLAGNAADAAHRTADLSNLPDSPRRDLVLGHLSLLTGNLAGAETLLSRAWAGGLPGPEAAHAASQLAQLCLIQGRGADAAGWARRAIDAHPEGGPAVAALSRLMCGLANAGRSEEAMALVEGAPETPEHFGPAEVDLLLGRGIVRLWTDRLDGARRDLLAATMAVRSWGHLKEAAIFLTHLADAEYRLGLWDDSLAHADQAASLAEDSDQAWLLGGTHAMVVFPLAARGLWDLAESHARRAVEAAAALPEGEEANRGYAASAAAHLASARGDPAGVVTAVRPILAFRNRAGSYEPGTMPWRELYAEALVALRRLNEADAALRPYEELAAERRRRSSQAAAARVRGALEAARGRGGEARQAFEAALDHAEAVPVPFEQALARHAYGSFLRRAGERRAALAQLSQARETFVRLDARPFLARADRELAGTGLAPSRRSVLHAGHVPLTPQELAVSRLVAAGRTNKEVAGELVVSVKTVEYHLANVFAKLRITSRRELRSQLGAGR
jgi:DNA-binding CsgD family transcriptional regulator